MKDIKVCLISSSGGHIEELMQLNKIREKYSHFFMFPETAWTRQIDGKKYFILDMNRKNKCTKLFSLFKMFFQQIFIYFKERPNLIVTTGAVVALPICLYAKVFHKKIIFIESIARVTSCSQTGKIMVKLADLFIVQWEDQLKCYPEAKYGGWIF